MQERRIEARLDRRGKLKVSKRRRRPKLEGG